MTQLCWKLNFFEIFTRRSDERLPWNPRESVPFCDVSYMTEPCDFKADTDLSQDNVRFSRLHQKENLLTLFRL
jgi:hypothetical protein